MVKIKILDDQDANEPVPVLDDQAENEPEPILDDQPADDPEPEFEVEKILRERMNKKGQTEYFLKWMGWNGRYNSWQPSTNLKNCDQLIKDWEDSKKENSGPKSVVSNQASIGGHHQQRKKLKPSWTKEQWEKAARKKKMAKEGEGTSEGTAASAPPGKKMKINWAPQHPDEIVDVVN